MALTPPKGGELPPTPPVVIPTPQPLNPEPPKPELPKVITPEWEKVIGSLLGRGEALEKDRDGWKEKALALDAEVKKVKLSAPPEVKQLLDANFAPWDLFFGE